MRRCACVLVVVVWLLLAVRVMTVDACRTDPVARLVAVTLLVALLPYLWWRLVSYEPRPRKKG